MTEQIAVTVSANPSSTIKPTHFAYLDGLRALAALYVVLFHALIQVEPNGQASLGKAQIFASLFTFGHQAVDLFIVISGFCLMLPVIKREGELAGGTYLFFKKRARRILPPYFIALTITLILIQTSIGNKTGTIWDSSVPVTTNGLISHLLLLQDVSPYTVEQINGAFWSISVEWRIYFAFPILVLCWRKLGPLVTVAFSMLVSCIFLYLLQILPLHYDGNSLVGIMPQYLGLFTLGMLGADICYSREKRISAIRQHTPWGMLMCGSMIAVFILCKVRTIHGVPIPVPIIDLIAGICAMSVLITISINETSKLRSFLSLSYLSFVGTFAYSIYLIHGPLQQILWQYILHPLNLQPLTTFLVQSTLGTAVIVGLSYGFFLFGERPFLKTISSRKS